MNEEADLLLDMAEESMKQTLDFLSTSLSRVRAGKASTSLLDTIRADYYGTPTPLANMSTITTPDARTIAIQPWEKKLIKDIEKAILASDLGITPANNGEVIHLTIPPLTEERRRELSRKVRSEAEDAKVSIRNARREAIDGFKKLVKDGMSEDLGKNYEALTQDKHDLYIKQIDAVAAEKEKEIMTV